ncbi:endonuclease [Segetibacter aerophilus]|uniref:Endonuclease n=2 Tax=Segetibacter aerophilus TaxID=670293 RepID=A0A512BAL9_9BACT|nr:endonuclease [Segetibacter aerophilus]
MAWGMLGHRIVGEIASNYLTSKANREIKKILGNESIAMSSNWADFIKSDSNYRYLNEWHYVNVDKGLNAAQMELALQKDTAASAYTRLNFLIAQLKNKELPQSDKVMYLRLLIHIVGDIHQPFHVSATGDRGGNDIKITWFNEASNAHRLWDEQLIELQQLSYTEYTKAINFSTAMQRSDWQKMPVSNWFFDSYRLSEVLHEELKKPDQKLSYQYNYSHLNTLNEQLLKGGIRLAALLNEIFG